MSQNNIGYQNPLYLTQAQRKVHALYYGPAIVKQHDVLFVIDTEEILELAKDNILKMHAKQNGLIIKDTKVNIAPIDYAAFNKLSKHFVKHFVPQKQLSTKQAFWLPISKFVYEIPLVQPKPVQRIPHEVPNISLVKDSFNKMRSHVNDFENVVTVRTKEAHIDYLKHTKEHADTLREIVKQARELRPFDSDLDFACRTFTIDGNMCPLTRITSTIVVPPKKPLSTTVVKKTPSSSNTSGKLKDINNIGSSSKSKISNNSKPNKIRDLMFPLLLLLPVSISDRSTSPLVSGLGLLQAHDQSMLLSHQLC
nr:hypothetical protein [Tanacetum cinerariifolium]